MSDLQTVSPNQPIQSLHQDVSELLESGLLPKFYNDEYKKNKQSALNKAMAVVTKGMELGVPIWTAITKIHVIHGNPTVSPELMMALIRRSGLLADFAITHSDNESCTITARRGQEREHTETFTFREASMLKTKEDGKNISLTDKYNWRQQPNVMLRWRCISRWARTYFPDVVMGVYTPEELAPDMSFNLSGDIIDAPPPPQELVIEESRLTDYVILGAMPKMGDLVAGDTWSIIVGSYGFRDDLNFYPYDGSGWGLHSFKGYISDEDMKYEVEMAFLEKWKPEPTVKGEHVVIKDNHVVRLKFEASTTEVTRMKNPKVVLVAARYLAFNPHN